MKYPAASHRAPKTGHQRKLSRSKLRGVDTWGDHKVERLAILYCDGRRFRQIIIAGANRVTKNRDLLNKINVFPVPDGDTGTNMSMTLSAAVRERRH